MWNLGVWPTVSACGGCKRPVLKTCPFASVVVGCKQQEAKAGHRNLEGSLQGNSEFRVSEFTRQSVHVWWLLETGIWPIISASVETWARI